jgi:hypothetical protein
VRRQRDGQQREREEHEEELRDRLAAYAEEARRDVREGVAAEQDGLEEDERDEPHRRRAAEQRQQHLPDHRLEEETSAAPTKIEQP